MQCILWQYLDMISISGVVETDSRVCSEWRMLAAARGPPRPPTDHQRPPGLRSPEGHQVCGGQQLLQGKPCTSPRRHLFSCMHDLLSGFCEGDSGLGVPPVLFGSSALRSAQHLAVIHLIWFDLINFPLLIIPSYFDAKRANVLIAMYLCGSRMDDSFTSVGSIIRVRWRTENQKESRHLYNVCMYICVNRCTVSYSKWFCNLS